MTSKKLMKQLLNINLFLSRFYYILSTFITGNLPQICCQVAIRCDWGAWCEFFSDNGASTHLSLVFSVWCFFSLWRLSRFRWQARSSGCHVTSSFSSRFCSTVSWHSTICLSLLTGLYWWVYNINHLPVIAYWTILVRERYNTNYVWVLHTCQMHMYT